MGNKKKSNQKEKLLAYLKENKSITYFESFSEIGIARLAARISDLRAEGHNIETIMKKVISSQTGREHTVAVYYYNEAKE